MLIRKLLCFMLVAAFVLPAQAAGWVTEGEQTIPSSGTVLADTGQLPEGTRSIDGVISITGAGVILIQHRNAANNSTIKQHAFTFVAADKFVLPTLTLDAASNERIRIVTSGTILVTVQASLSWR